VTTLTATPGAVWSTAFSPDGQFLMTAGGGGVKFWRTGTWELVTNFPGQIASLSKTGSLVAIADSCPLYWEQLGPVSLWDYRTGSRLRQFDRPGRALALSPDGKQLAVAGSKTGVNLWDTASGELRRTLETESPVWSVSFSPRGDKLATAGWVSETLVWDLETNRPPIRLKGHSLTVWVAIFSPDGSSLLTASSDQTVRSWDTVDFHLRNILHGHDNEVWCATFSPDGRTLATGGKDQTVRLWPADLPIPIENLPHAVDVPPIFSPDGSRLALAQSGDPQKRGQVWDLNRRAPLADIPGPGAIGFSPDGNAVVCVDNHAATLEFWWPERPHSASVTLTGIEPGKVNFVKSGLSPERTGFFAIDQSGSIRFWETTTGKLLASLNGPKQPVRNAVLGPGGKHLALSIESENFVRLYDPAPVSEKHLSGHRDFVSGLAFSPDGTILASGSMDGTIRLWDTATGAALSQLPGHMEEVTDVAFCPDGRTLASVGRKNSVKFWHLATHRELLSVDFPQAGAYLRFSPDGRYLAVTAEDNLLHLFDAPSLAEMEAHAEQKQQTATVVGAGL
jgi:WD40 repeat protein